MDNKLNNLKFKINGQEYNFEGGSGSNIDIYTEDNYLVINTDGTESRSAGSGNTGGSCGGSSGGSGLTKLTYTVPNEKISVTYVFTGSENPPNSDKVVISDSGLQEFIINNKDSLFMRFIFESETNMEGMGLVSVKEIFEVTSKSNINMAGMSQDCILLGRSTTHYVTDDANDDNNVVGGIYFDAGGVYILNDGMGETTPNCFMMQCRSTMLVSQMGGSMTITVECYKVE